MGRAANYRMAMWNTKVDQSKWEKNERLEKERGRKRANIGKENTKEMKNKERKREGEVI